MEIAVRYYTRSGNTQKLAQAIGEAVGAQAEPVSSPLPKAVDILLLGCSYYAFDVDEAVKRFIFENKGQIGQIVCFGTSAMMKSLHKPMQKVAKEAGVALAKEEFHCRGAFGPMHKGRPDQSDLRRAAAFAEQIINTAK